MTDDEICREAVRKARENEAKNQAQVDDAVDRFGAKMALDEIGRRIDGKIARTLKSLEEIKAMIDNGRHQ